jgi:diacylglycerol kinase family enzyme
LGARIRRALDGDADTIVAAGGDGTVLAVAEGLIGSDKQLAVLPLGTLNGLARDLGLALDLPGAVAQLASLEPRAIDVGEVNGRPFLHNVIVGLIPSIAVGRELIRGRAGLSTKLLFLRFILRRLTHARRIALALRSDDGATRIEMVQTLVVANNSYDQRVGRIMARRRLDRGTMTVYLIRNFRLRDVIRLSVEMAAGRWRDDEVIEIEKVHDLTVQAKGERVRVTMDGEVTRLETPLQFTVLPRSLLVLAPPEPVVTAAPDAALAPAGA